MKELAYVLLIALICIGLFYVNKSDKPVEVPTYSQGIPDTIIIKDTVKLYVTKRSTITRIDTVFTSIDTTNKTVVDSIRTLWCDYNIQVDTTVEVLGKVRLNGLYFEFDSTNVIYPKVTVLQVDTIKLPTKRTNFYENEWFYATIVAIITLFIK